MYCKTLTSQGKKQGLGLYGFTYIFSGHVTCATRGYVTWEVLGAKQIIGVLEKKMRQKVDWGKKGCMSTLQLMLHI